MKPETTVKVYLITGLVLVVVCSLFAGLFGVIFNAILYNILVISPDGSIYETYIAPDVPIYMDFYMFNVTNPEEVQYFGAKPILQEIGPYRYLETYRKWDLDFSDDGNTVSYFQNKTYYFQPDQSVGLESDRITTVNAVMVVIASRIASLNPAIKALGELLFLRFKLAENLFMTKSVSELLFDGYYDPFIDLLGKLTGDPKHIEGMFGFKYKVIAGLLYENHKITELIWPNIEKGMDVFEEHSVGELTFSGWDLPEFNFDFSNLAPNIPMEPEFNNSVLNIIQTFDKILIGTEGLNGTLYEILKEFNKTVDYLEPNKIGIFYGANGTDDGRYKVYTGKGGMDNYLNIVEWQEQPDLDYWGTPYCNMLNGTDGSQFPPNVKTDMTIRLFTSDLCRSVYALFAYTVKVGDLEAFRFSLPRKALIVEECFCQEEFSCRDTMVDIRKCQKGAPIILSTPHYYQGDESDVNNFVGIKPVKDLHETYLDVEPITGVVLEAAKRIQLNVPLRNYANLPAFRNVPEVVFPIFWADENYQLPEDDTKTLHKTLTLPFTLVYSICGILIFVGIGLIILGLIKRRVLKKEVKFGKLEKK